MTHGPVGGRCVVLVRSRRVRLVFGPHDHEEYSAARERLGALVVGWASLRGTPVDPAMVAAALDHRNGVDGRLGHWTRDHVARTLGVSRGTVYNKMRKFNLDPESFR